MLAFPKRVLYNIDAPRGVLIPYILVSVITHNIPFPKPSHFYKWLGFVFNSLFFIYELFFFERRIFNEFLKPRPCRELFLFMDICFGN